MLQLLAHLVCTAFGRREMLSTKRQSLWIIASTVRECDTDSRARCVQLESAQHSTEMNAFFRSHASSNWHTSTNCDVAWRHTINESFNRSNSHLMIFPSKCPKWIFPSTMFANGPQCDSFISRCELIYSDLSRLHKNWQLKSSPLSPYPLN